MNKSGQQIDPSLDSPRRLSDPCFWWIAGLLLLAVGVAFLPVLHNGFVIWDDEKNFLGNFAYRGLGTSQITWAWTTFLLGVYQPFAWMLLEVQYVIWKVEPWGYHLTSLLLHAATSFTLYLFTVNFLTRFVPRGAAGSERLTFVSAGVATLFFSAHPLRAEVIAWASCQPYLPCALFYVLGVSAYLQAFPSNSPPRRRWLIAAFFLFVAALLFKAPAVTLPVILVLLDWYPLRRLGEGPGRWLGPAVYKVWLEKLPFFAVSLVFMVVAIAAKRHSPNLMAIQVQPGGLGTAQIAQASYGIWFYLLKTIWPTGIVAYYPVPPGLYWWSRPIFMLSIFGTFAATAALIWNSRRRPALFGAWMSYLTILAPNLGIITISKQIAADRYCYLAMMPLTILLAAAIREYWTPLRSLVPLRIMFACLATAMSITLIALTWNQTLTWRSSESLWRYAANHGGATDPDVCNFLGLALAQNGKVEEAKHYFLEAIRSSPSNAEAHNNLGTALAREGKLEEAAVHFNETVRIRPNHVEAHNNLGSIYAKRRQYENAIAEYAKSLEFDPENLTAYQNLEFIVLNVNSLDEASRQHALIVLANSPQAQR